MKLKKHYAKWLMITLIMAIGIGTFAALTIANEKDKEENEAQSSSYLTNQRQKDIDMKELKTLLGDFDEDGGYWHLFITDDFEDKGPYMSVYDAGAGNPGFEGRIMYLKDGIVIVEIDEDLYEGMIDGWEHEGKGKYEILDYERTDRGIILGYRGKEVRFSSAKGKSYNSVTWPAGCRSGLPAGFSPHDTQRKTCRSLK